MTNVITVYQPHASLIMAGVKTWETRGNPPHGDMRPKGVRGLPGRRINAGDRILIHAAAREPVAGADVGGWWWEPDMGDPVIVSLDDHRQIPAPLGKILGSVRADRAVRIVEDGGPLPNIWTIGGLRLWSEKSPYPEDEWECPLNSLDISDQLPFGYWNPGNWAWQLSDPQPFAEPIPAKGKQGVWEWTA